MPPPAAAPISVTTIASAQKQSPIRSKMPTNRKVAFKFWNEVFNVSWSFEANAVFILVANRNRKRNGKK